MWTNFKVFIEFVTILLLFCFFGREACGILAPRPELGIEHAAPALEGEVSLSLFFFNLIYLFIYLSICLFLAVLGLCCFMRAFSSCRERGLLFFEVRGLLISVASLVVEHRF